MLPPPEAVAGEGRLEGDDPGRWGPWLLPSHLCQALQARQVGEETEVEKDVWCIGAPDGWVVVAGFFSVCLAGDLSEEWIQKRLLFVEAQFRDILPVKCQALTVTRKQEVPLSRETEWLLTPTGYWALSALPAQGWGFEVLLGD